MQLRSYTTVQRMANEAANKKQLHASATAQADTAADAIRELEEELQRVTAALARQRAVLTDRRAEAAEAEQQADDLTDLVDVACDAMGWDVPEVPKDPPLKETEALPILPTDETQTVPRVDPHPTEKLPIVPDPSTSGPMPAAEVIDEKLDDFLDAHDEEGGERPEPGNDDRDDPPATAPTDAAPGDAGPEPPTDEQDKPRPASAIRQRLRDLTTFALIPLWLVELAFPSLWVYRVRRQRRRRVTS